LDLIASVWSPMPTVPWACLPANIVLAQDEGAWFESDGKVGFVSRESLASSVVGMDTMVRNMYENTSAELHEAIRMATLTPAERVGMDDEIGSLEVGKRADFILLDPTLGVREIRL
jgi:N-acetylglucosamine-6-phosphate deacetylase